MDVLRTDEQALEAYAPPEIVDYGDLVDVTARTTTARPSRRPAAPPAASGAPVFLVLTPTPTSPFHLVVREVDAYAQASDRHRSEGMEQLESVDYETPVVVDYGDLVELTAGSTDGDFTDAAFPVNTPKRDLTFELETRSTGAPAQWRVRRRRRTRRVVCGRGAEARVRRRERRRARRRPRGGRRGDRRLRAVLQLHFLLTLWHVLAAVAYSRLQASMPPPAPRRSRSSSGTGADAKAFLPSTSSALEASSIAAPPVEFVFATDVRELLPLLETTPPPSEPTRTLARRRRSDAAGDAALGDRTTARRPPAASRRRQTTAHAVLGSCLSAARRARYGCRRRATARRGWERALARSCARGRPARSPPQRRAGFHQRGCTRPRPPRASRRVFRDVPAAPTHRRARPDRGARPVSRADDGVRLVPARRDAARHAAVPRRGGFLPPPRTLLPRAAALAGQTEGITTMLDGQGGDELFGLSPYLAADRFLAGRLREVDRLLRLTAGSRAARRAAFRQVVLEGALPYRAHRLALARPQATRAELVDGRRRRPLRGRQRAVAVESRTGAAVVGTPHPRHHGRRERAGVHDWLRHAFAHRRARRCAPVAPRRRPRRDGAALPPEHAWDARHDRPMLREALRGLLPDSIRLRADKSYFNDVLGAAVRRRRPGDRVAAGGPNGGEPPCVPGARRASAGTASVTVGRRETWLLWRLVTLECWLRMQADTDFLDTARKVPSRGSRGRYPAERPR